VLDDVDRLRKIVREAASAGGCTLLDLCSHRFEPHGATVVALLAESHISVHTWPEQGAAAADIFTCGDGQAIRAAATHLGEALGADDTNLIEVPRGAPTGASR
jgi:S-adenosylmethionine decarboxylase proenzyme